MAKSLTRILEEGLAPEGRRVVSDWRAQLLFRRHAFESSGGHDLSQFRTLAKTRVHLDRLVQSQDLLLLDKDACLYQVLSPYASKDPVLDWELLMEANPYCAVAFYSAMVFHHLTEDFPKGIHAMIPGQTPDWLPPGITDVDLEMSTNLPAHSRRVEKLRDVPVEWHVIKNFDGVREYHTFTYPVRATTLERTILDGLAHPEWCGGLESVFRAWRKAKDTIKIHTLVDLVDAINKPLLRQRAGFVMETLGITSPNLEAWTKKAITGGSSKLLGTAPFVKEGYSERWQLSINAPIRTLEEHIFD